MKVTTVYWWLIYSLEGGSWLDLGQLEGVSLIKWGTGTDPVDLGLHWWGLTRVLVNRGKQWAK